MTTRVMDPEMRRVIDDMAQLDGSQVLARYGIELNRSGSAHCPFHEDRTPSFHWHRRINRMKCFGASCPTNGESMDNIAFVMRLKGLRFMEALTDLGAPTRDDILPPLRTFKPQSDLVELSRKDREILAWVAQHYHDLLMGHIHPHNPVAQHARAYLQSRGITRETAVSLKLGVSDGRTLLSMQREYPDMAPTLERLRIITRGRRNSQRLFERFRGFLTAPNHVTDESVDFIYGRATDPDPKMKFMGPSDYRKPIYGLARAQESSENGLDVLHLAEGLFDGITLMQWGLPGSVALCGQADHSQLRQLEGFRVYAALDNDDGGRAILTRLRDALGHMVADVRLPEEFKDVGDLAGRQDGFDIYQKAAREAQQRMGWHTEGGEAGAQDHDGGDADARPEDS